MCSSDLAIDKKERIWARVSRKQKISILVLLSAMGSNLREILDNVSYPEIITEKLDIFQQLLNINVRLIVRHVSGFLRSWLVVHICKTRSLEGKRQEIN